MEWNSTSDSFIVYAYFIGKIGVHHFYIIDLGYDKAHTLIENNRQIPKWVAIAKQFRLQNIWYSVNNTKIPCLPWSTGR